MVEAFDDAQVGRVAALPAGERPLAILPVGGRRAPGGAVTGRFRVGTSGWDYPA